MKQYYTGDIKFLTDKGYELECDYCKRYFQKTVRDRKTNKTLTCFINAKTKEIDYVGEHSMKVYYDKELEGQVIKK